jgi:methyltransferase-like protein
MLFPEIEFVGVDLSKIQIDDGKKEIADLGLKNIELKHMSLSDIDADFGEFDYIICHGVFSWVPKSVQQDIMRVCKRNMSKHGVAYISYNTLPGWSTVSAIRDMMVYHTRNFSTPNEKVSQAVGMLRFALENQNDESNHWKIALKSELDTLLSHNPSYIFHDHLEENNNPLYFYQFIEMAKQAGLQYLGESSLASMYVGNMSVNAAAILKNLTDQVGQEQYMDFVRNRRFRQTLLCHDSNRLNFNLSSEKVFEFYISLASHIKPDFNPALEDWTKEASRSFCSGAFTVIDRVVAIALTLLYEKNGMAISSDEVVTEVTKKLGWNNELTVHAIFGDNAMELAMRGIIILHDGPEKCVQTVSKKPEVWSYTRHRLNTHGYFVNVKLESCASNFVSAELVKLLDGNRTKEEAIEELKKILKERGIEVKDKDGNLLTEEADIDKNIEVTALEQLGFLMANSLLVA